MFDSAEVVSADGSSSEHFDLICCKCVDTYVTVKKNQNQICWKFQKVGSGSGCTREDSITVCAATASPRPMGAALCRIPVQSPPCLLLPSLAAAATVHQQVHTPQPRPPLHRTFLDTQQYSDTSIAQYERVFGRGFISPGGQQISASLLDELQLTEGLKVLDVGCGIGGETVNDL